MGLVSARKAAKLTQAEVGKVLGVSDSAVAQWETGKTIPKASHLPKLAILYHCTIDDLFKPDGEETLRQK